MKTPHKDFNVFDLIDELKHEKKLYKAETKHFLSKKMYANAAITDETVNTLDFVIEKLIRYTTNGND